MKTNIEYLGRTFVLPYTGKISIAEWFSAGVECHCLKTINVPLIHPNFDRDSAQMWVILPTVGASDSLRYVYNELGDGEKKYARV